MARSRRPPTIAWRAWRVDQRGRLCGFEDSGGLAGVNTVAPANGVYRAGCLQSRRRCAKPPGPRCECGAHVVKQLSALLSYLQRAPIRAQIRAVHGGDGTPDAIGTVRPLGRVLPCTHRLDHLAVDPFGTWRAERYVLTGRLYVHPATDLERLRRNYGEFVELVALEDTGTYWPAAIREHELKKGA